MPTEMYLLWDCEALSWQYNYTFGEIARDDQVNRNVFLVRLRGATMPTEMYRLQDCEG